jgi:hypothetical protein
MSHARAFVLLFVLAATLCAYAKDKVKDKDKAQPEGWLAITQQDLAIKEVPNDSGADAIQLFMSYCKDDDAKFISVYHRIKILSDAGRKRTDVEIPSYKTRRAGTHLTNPGGPLQN